MCTTLFNATDRLKILVCTYHGAHEFLRYSCHGFQGLGGGMKSSEAGTAIIDEGAG